MAAVLTHDVDQLYDRELFRILADANHIRRIFTSHERGNLRKSVQRIIRSIFKPKPAGNDVRRIRTLERRYGWPSTFFLLEDRYWARYGSRYRWNDSPVKRIAQELQDEGCEISIHGSFYHYDDPQFLLRKRQEFERIFGVTPIGIRNHYLRFSGMSTWRAQETSGFQYDSTYGYNNHLGPRAGLSLPFFPTEEDHSRTVNVLELPLTVMDQTLFRRLRMAKNEAVEFLKAQIVDLTTQGGLGVFLWHNNYFDEPEYIDWEETFSALLQMLKDAGAWVTTAAEINRWWRDESAITVDAAPRTNQWTGWIQARKDLHNFKMVLSGYGECDISVDGPDPILDRKKDALEFHFPHLLRGDHVRVHVRSKGQTGERD